MSQMSDSRALKLVKGVRAAYMDPPSELGANAFLQALVAYLDENEPTVANAIRFGLSDATTVYNRWELDTAIACGVPLYVLGRGA